MTTMIDFTPAPAYSMEPSQTAAAAPRVADDAPIFRVSNVFKLMAWLSSIAAVGILLGMEIHYFWNQGQMTSGGWGNELNLMVFQHAFVWFMAFGAVKLILVSVRKMIRMMNRKAGK